MTYGCAEATVDGCGCEDCASRRHEHIAARMADTNTTADFIGEAPFLRVTNITRPTYESRYLRSRCSAGAPEDSTSVEIHWPKSCYRSSMNNSALTSKSSSWGKVCNAPYRP